MKHYIPIWKVIIGVFTRGWVQKIFKRKSFEWKMSEGNNFLPNKNRLIVEGMLFILNDNRLIELLAKVLKTFCNFLQLKSLIFNLLILFIQYLDFYPN